MNTAAELLAECGRRGVVVTAVGDRLRVRGPGGAVGALRSALIARKPEIIAALAGCPSCRRPTDEKRRCWHCHDRACVRCGRQTGSAFIAHCVACGLTGEVS